MNDKRTDGALCDATADSGRELLTHTHRCGLTEGHEPVDIRRIHRCAYCEQPFEVTPSNTTQSDGQRVVGWPIDLGTILTMGNRAEVTDSDGGEGSSRKVSDARPTLHGAASLSVTQRGSDSAFAQVTGLQGSREGNTLYPDVEPDATTPPGSTERDGNEVAQSEVTASDPGYDRSTSRPVTSIADGWALRAATAVRDLRACLDWFARWSNVDDPRASNAHFRLLEASSTMADLTAWLATRQAHPLGVSYENTGEELLPGSPWVNECPAATGQPSETKGACPVSGAEHRCSLPLDMDSHTVATHRCECGEEWVTVTNLDESLTNARESGMRKALRDKGIGLDVSGVDVSIHTEGTPSFFMEDRVLVRVTGRDRAGERRWSYHLVLDKFGDDLQFVRPTPGDMPPVDGPDVVWPKGAPGVRAPLPAARPVLREDVAAEEMRVVQSVVDEVKPGVWRRIQDLINQAKVESTIEAIERGVRETPTAQRVSESVGLARRIEVAEKRIMRLAGELGTEIEARTGGDNAAYDLARAVGERVDVCVERLTSLDEALSKLRKTVVDNATYVASSVIGAGSVDRRVSTLVEQFESLRETVERQRGIVQWHKHEIDHDNPLLHRLSELQGRVLALEYGTRVAGLGQGPTLNDVSSRLDAFESADGGITDQVRRLTRRVATVEDMLGKHVHQPMPDAFTPEDAARFERHLQRVSDESDATRREVEVYRTWIDGFASRLAQVERRQTAHTHQVHMSEGASLRDRLDAIETRLTQFAPDEFTPSDEVQELIERYERGGFTPGEFKSAMRRLHSRLVQSETLAGSTDSDGDGTVSE